ncbi:S8 family serine peptidase [Paractinoplanes globisporus]|uniref:S8 family serine peptidase n=1 Tax=Paractinoplanes globisporus TaxID=113565 RepID=A0ABW6W9S6_9ACTN|nr:S8 family serine peptidase [Actinoplanes globisporus]
MSASSGAVAAPSARQDFAPVPAGSKITQVPLGMRNKPVTVMVQLADQPVAAADAAAAQPLTATQKNQRRDKLRQEQAPVEQRARQLGGTVLGTYQHAYNGIKVRVNAGQLDALAAAPGVVSVHALQTVKPDNTKGVPMIGAPTVWNTPDKYRGEGIKVAVIDTGIDYTHADFGGPGTTAAYETAHAAETAPADKSLFGPKAPKVKGGIDLVGDSYNSDPNSADYQPVPHPDSNPLDCNGHGSHVGGTIAGYGVLANGKTYTGSYGKTTVSGNSWLVGPGVAPKADLYAVRVFGCEGSTDMTVDAIEWAVANDMDVINMSLGSPFGTADAPESVAADNAAKDGVIVVASAGNSGAAPYIVGSPSTATSTISVAANDPTPSFPGAHLSIGVDAVNANGATFADGTSLPLKVVGNGAGGISLGCSTADFTAAGVQGAIAVVARGTCARVAKAIYGQAAGAAAVIQVNSDGTYPPFEGAITSNPDTGEPANVTIPFLGVPNTSAAALVAANGQTITLTNAPLTNPSYTATASFSSGGARVGDSWLKPDVTAPGVSISSVGVGSGTGAVVESGTSMAAPHTAGEAALVKQAHRDWRKVSYWKAAIVNTANPGGVAGYSTRLDGSGLIQAPGAVDTQVIALGDGGTATLNYGFAELDRDYTKTKVIKVKNFARTSQTFSISVGQTAGSPHKAKLSRTRVTVPGRGEAQVAVTLSVPAATAGDSAQFQDVSGLVTFTPVSRSGVALRVPYYLVPQSVSNIDAYVDTNALRWKGSATATVTNRHGIVPGLADWYAWGLSDGRDAATGAADLRAVGVQSLPADGAIAFAVSTHNRLSNAARNEFDIYVDVNGDGTDDYDVVGVDYGLLTTGDLTGQLVTAVFDLRTGDGTLEFFADAPYDSSTLVLPVLTSQLCAEGSPCLSADNPRLTYHAASFGVIDGNNDEIAGTASFNAFTPSLTTGFAGEVAPNKAVSEKVSLDKAEFAKTPAKGWMVVSHGNASRDEAQLISVSSH